MKIVAFLTAITFVYKPFQSQAELPILNKKPWLGYFIGCEENDYLFGITSGGVAKFSPLQNGKPFAMQKQILIQFNVIETTSTGTSIRKKIKVSSLHSDQEATKEFKNVVTFKGKVTGEATFEVTVTPQKKGASFTGKILDKGRLKNPLHFEISLNTTIYGQEPDEKILRRESVNYITSKNQKGTVRFSENPFSEIKEEISSIELKTDGLGDTKFKFEAFGSSNLKFTDKGGSAWKGIHLIWRANEAAASESQGITITSK